ncbi:MAG TPA: hypothetical protein VF801_01315 [Rhodocyclaceae bacterium]
MAPEIVHSASATRACLARAAIAAAMLASGLPALAADAKHCYRGGDPVACLVDIARHKLARVTGADERAGAVGDLLFTLAATGGDDAALTKEARALAENRSVGRVRQMDLLYAIDVRESAIAPPAKDSYVAALGRFARLERELAGDELVELYFNACAIIDWDDPFRERWLDFAESVCTSERLKSVKADGELAKARLLAIMPIAMTLAEDRAGFARSTGEAMDWLRSAQAAAAKSRDAGRKDLVASVGVLMHAINSACLDAFDEPEASDAEVDRALRSLRRIEGRRGISGRTTALRRRAVESLFDTGRDAEAARLLERMLSRIDADPEGRTIPLAEQISILLLAARLEHYVDLEQEQEDAADGRIRM